MERKNAWSQYSAEELSRLEAVNEDYKACLDAGKTEREVVRLTIERIENFDDKQYVEEIDQEHFIGIITRRDIIGYCYDRLKECGTQDDH